MTVPLCPKTEAKLLGTFPTEDVAEARSYLETDCAHNVSGWQGAGLFRLRTAAIKLSGGSIPGLVDAIALAQTDFRDLLMAADFAEDVRAAIRFLRTRGYCWNHHNVH